MKIRVPEVGADYAAAFQSLTLIAHYRVDSPPHDLPPATARAHDDGAYSYRQTVTDERGRVGFHLRVSEAKEESESGEAGRWRVEYGWHFVADHEELGSGEDNALVDWVRGHDRRHPVWLSSTFYFEDGLGRSRFPLPLDIPAIDMPGFDEIGGVSLVKRDNENASEPLYTLILQRMDGDLYASIRTRLVSSMSEELLEEGLERAIGILRMGVA